MDAPIPITILVERRTRGWFMREIRFYRSTKSYQIPYKLGSLTCQPNKIADIIKHQIKEKRSISRLTINLKNLDKETLSNYLDLEELKFKMGDTYLEPVEFELNTNVESEKKNLLDIEFKKLKFNHNYDNVIIFIDKFLMIKEKFQLNDNLAKIKLINYAKPEHRYELYKEVDSDSLEEIIQKFKTKYKSNKCLDKSELQDFKLTDIKSVKEYVDKKYELAKIDLVKGKSPERVRYMIFNLFDQKARGYLDCKSVNYRNKNEIIYTIIGKMLGETSENTTIPTHDAEQTHNDKIKEIQDDLNRPNFF